jgi:hypothetical protein
MNDHAFKMSILERDGKCITCGEERMEYLTAHHILSRQWHGVRHDPRNAVTVCNNPRQRYVEGVGITEVDCHTMAEDNREWFLWRVMAYFVRQGIFRSAAEFVRFQGDALSGCVDSVHGLK